MNDYVKKIRMEVRILDHLESGFRKMRRDLKLWKKVLDTKASPEAKQFIAHRIRTRIVPALEEWIKELES